MDTYLPEDEPELTRELLNMMIEQIYAGPESAEILYAEPLPDDARRGLVESDLLTL